MQISDMEKLLLNLFNKVKKYSLPLIEIDDQDNLKVKNIASGTLVIIDGHYGILTARHVVNNIYIKTIDTIDPVTLDKFTLSILKVYSYGNENSVDIIFIALKNAEDFIVKTQKDFLILDNLEFVDRKWLEPNIDSQLLVSCVAVESRCFFAISYIDEDKCYEIDYSANRIVVNFKKAGPYAITPNLNHVDLKKVHGNCTDLIKAPINTKIDIPKQFHGMSGAVVWQALLDKENNALKILLAGVVIEQGSDQKIVQSILYHGPMTLHDIFLPSIRKKIHKTNKLIKV